jgi:hypothetical protein
MDSSKAKQAKSKAKARTKQKTADSAQQAAQLGALQQQQMAAQGLTPEIQAQNIAMQDQTQTVNPYHRMGQMLNNHYNPGNVIGGGYVPGS